MSKYVCREPGCGRGPGNKTGHGLYRTSPKGEPFEGACRDHYDGEPDPIVSAIELHNEVARASHE